MGMTMRGRARLSTWTSGHGFRCGARAGMLWIPPAASLTRYVRFPGAYGIKGWKCGRFDRRAHRPAPLDRGCDRIVQLADGIVRHSRAHRRGGLLARRDGAVRLAAGSAVIGRGDVTVMRSVQSRRASAPPREFATWCATRRTGEDQIATLTSFKASIWTRAAAKLRGWAAQHRQGSYIDIRYHPAQPNRAVFASADVHRYRHQTGKDLLLNHGLCHRLCRPAGAGEI